MPFFHVQGNSSALVTSGTTVAVTLTTPPVNGNLVCIAVIFADGVTPATVTVQDNNGNKYTITPNSPSIAQYVNCGALWLGYLVPAPPNAGATITATFNRTIVDAIISAEEFSFTKGRAAFDVDIVGSGTSGDPVTTPTITPAGAGELLYCYATPQNGLIATNAPWTQNAFGEDGDGGIGGYILSSNPGGTALNISQNPPPQGWDSMAMAFLLLPSIYIIAK